jgi:hypothetical protein
VKVVSFPEVAAETGQVLSKSQAFHPDHEPQPHLFETFPDIFDASLFSRHTHTPGHFHREETRAFSSHEMA